MEHHTGCWYHNVCLARLLIFASHCCWSIDSDISYHAWKDRMACSSFKGWKLFQLGPSQASSHNWFICYSGGWMGECGWQVGNSHAGVGHGAFYSFPSCIGGGMHSCALQSSIPSLQGSKDSKYLNFSDFLPRAWGSSFGFSRLLAQASTQPAANLRLWIQGKETSLPHCFGGYNWGCFLSSVFLILLLHLEAEQSL